MLSVRVGPYAEFYELLSASKVVDDPAFDAGWESRFVELRWFCFQALLDLINVRVERGSHADAVFRYQVGLEKWMK